MAWFVPTWFDTTSFLGVVLLISIWQLRWGLKAGFPAESGSTWELLFFCLTNACLIIFTLHRGFLWGIWDTGEDSFPCRVMVMWSGCEWDLVQNRYRCIHTLFSKPLSLPHLSATSMANTNPPHALKCLRFLRLYEEQNYVFCKRNKNPNYAQCKRVGEYGP